MQTTRKRLIIVDDDPNIFYVLQLVFEDEGDAVQIAPTALRFEQLLSRELPDLILLELLLSGKDGSLLIKYLKTQEQTQSLPVMLSSAYSGAPALAAGTDDFLAKPFNIEALLAMVARYVARGQ